MLRRIRIRLVLSDQLASAQGEMVGDVRRLPAENTPRVRVQVRAPDALPTGCVDGPATRRTVRVRFPGVLRAATTTGGQLGAPGDRARGAGSAGHGGNLHWDAEKPRRGSPGLLPVGFYLKLPPKIARNAANARSLATSLGCAAAMSSTAEIAAISPPVGVIATSTTENLANLSQSCKWHDAWHRATRALVSKLVIRSGCGVATSSLAAAFASSGLSRLVTDWRVAISPRKRHGS